MSKIELNIYSIFWFYVSILLVINASDVSPLQTWELLDETLTHGTRNAFSTWNENSSYPDCIFVFGGTGCTDCSTIFCFNTTSNTLEFFRGLQLESDSESSRVAYCDQSAFIIANGTHDILYWIDDIGNIYTYDLNADIPQESVIITINMTWGCLLKHPNNMELYIIECGPSTRGEFWIYDLATNTTVQGDTMNVARYRPGAIVSEYDPDNPCIYVMGGRTSYIERLNLNDARNNRWEVLQLLMDTSISDQFDARVIAYYAHGIIAYKNFIYLIGGSEDTVSARDDIVSLDIENWKIEWAGVFPTNIAQFTATLAFDRIYTFGGGAHGLVQNRSEIYASNELKDNSNGRSVNVSPLQTWQLSSSSLPGGTRNAFSAWPGTNSNFSDCVFVFGGKDCIHNQCDTMFCYNTSSNNLESFGKLSIISNASFSTRHVTCVSNAFVISDIIYWMNTNGSAYTYDLNGNLTREEFKTTIIDVQYPCLLKHPNDTQFFVINDTNDYETHTPNEFWIYDLVTNTTMQGNTMNAARYRPAAIVSEYDTDNPYIYVMGGHSKYIERLNLNNPQNGEWELLQLLLESSISDEFDVAVNKYSAHGIATFANFIYLIGGYDSGNETDKDDIILLDIENWEIKWAGVYPTGISRFAVSFAQDRIYGFGGHNGPEHTTDYDLSSIYISNELEYDPTSFPTPIPTQIIPSSTPSVDSVALGYDPSIFPTTIPTETPMNSASSPTPTPTTLNYFQLFNFSQALNILVNSSTQQYNSAHQLKNNAILQQDISSLLEEASEYMISNTRDEVIAIQIDQIWDYNYTNISHTNCNGKENISLSESFYLSWIRFNIKFSSSKKQDAWENNLEYIIQILDNQMSKLDYFINDTVSIVCYCLSSDDSSNNQSGNQPSVTPSVPPSDQITVNDNSGDDMAYLIVIICIIGCFICIGLCGCVDAKFIRRNEIFSFGAVMSMATYTIDIVSGL